MVDLYRSPDRCQFRLTTTRQRLRKQLVVVFLGDCAKNTLPSWIRCNGKDASAPSRRSANSVCLLSS